MKEKFKFIFVPRYYDELVSDFNNGNLGYNPWTKIDIIVNGHSFFNKMVNEQSHILTGFGGPLFNLAEELIKLPNKLITENIVLYTDPDFQIDRSLIFEYKENEVVFAMIKDNYWYDDYDEWYQGEKWVHSSPKIVPKSKINTIDFQSFKTACYESIKDLLKDLQEKYPDIVNTNGYKLLRKELTKNLE